MSVQRSVDANRRRPATSDIAMHPSASGLLVIDVDHSERAPNCRWPLLNTALSQPTTDDPTSRRGHHYFRLRRGPR
jgi:hypothetical protein